MGLFSKKANQHPSIETQGLRIVYHLDHEWWEFGLQDTNFISHGSTFSCPTQAQLALILSDIAKLRPEMIQRLAKGWNGWKGVRMNDGEEYSVNLTDFHSDGGFEVSWSGGATWGDMGINFKIKDHAITDELWGD